jgi:hypothetical protein
MKKLILSICIVGLAYFAYAQPVSDNAVIPVSVNLNSILRLNVTSGGNIEFSFNSIGQYTSGISNSDRTDTHFTVSSSIDFDVELWAEDLTFLGTDNPAHTLALNYVAYDMEVEGSGTEGALGNWVLPAGWAALANGTADIVTSNVGSGAGDAAKNAFIINWECGTANCPGGNLLAASRPADRYATNVFLVLVSH